MKPHIRQVLDRRVIDVNGANYEIEYCAEYGKLSKAKIVGFVDDENDPETLHLIQNIVNENLTDWENEYL